VAHAGAARDLAQTQAIGSVLGENLIDGGKQSGAEVAMMIGRTGC